MDTKPLLSIFIPTKNGIQTIAFAIDSILSIQRKDLEVIVHDCSDDQLIKEFVDKKYKSDSKFKYYRTENSLSMTENFNKALSKCNGKYVCGIGDDDALLPNVMSIVDWMDKNKIECIKQPMSNYFWPSPNSSSLFNGKLRISKNFDSSVYKMDIKKNFKAIVANCGFGYVEGLPSVYHAIVKLDLIKQHYKKTGHFIGGSSFDVYSACAFPDYLNNTYLINVPFSIFGAGPKSNTMKNINAESLDSHYDDFSHVNDFTYLPKLRNSHVSTTESLIEALIDTGKAHMINSINLAVIYGKCAADQPKLFLSLLRRFLYVKNKKSSIFGFIFNFLIFLLMKLRFNIKILILGICSKLLPTTFDFIVNKYSRSKVLPAKDIHEAIKILEKEIILSDINLNGNIIES